MRLSNYSALARLIAGMACETREKTRTLKIGKEDLGEN